MPLNIECSVVSCYCMCAGMPVPESEVFLARLHRARWDGTPAGKACVLTLQTFTHRVISVGSCTPARNGIPKPYGAQSLSSALNLGAHSIPLLGHNFNPQTAGQREKKKLHLHLGNGVFLKWSNLFCTRNILKKQLCSLTSLIHKRSSATSTIKSEGTLLSPRILYWANIY